MSASHHHQPPHSQPRPVGIPAHSSPPASLVSDQPSSSSAPYNSHSELSPSVSADSSADHVWSVVDGDSFSSMRDDIWTVDPIDPYAHPPHSPSSAHSPRPHPANAFVVDYSLPQSSLTKVLFVEPHITSTYPGSMLGPSPEIDAIEALTSRDTDGYDTQGPSRPPPFVSGDLGGSFQGDISDGDFGVDDGSGVTLSDVGSLATVATVGELFAAFSSGRAVDPNEVFDLDELFLSETQVSPGRRARRPPPQRFSNTFRRLTPIEQNIQFKLRRTLHCEAQHTQSSLTHISSPAEEEKRFRRALFSFSPIEKKHSPQSAISPEQLASAVDGLWVSDIAGREEQPYGGNSYGVSEVGNSIAVGIPGEEEKNPLASASGVVYGDFEFYKGAGTTVMKKKNELSFDGKTTPFANPVVGGGGAHRAVGGGTLNMQHSQSGHGSHDGRQQKTDQQKHVGEGRGKRGNAKQKSKGDTREMDTATVIVTITQNQPPQLTCPKGSLLVANPSVGKGSKREKGFVCRMLIMVVPNQRKVCKKGYWYTPLNGGLCARIRVSAGVKLCPYPQAAVGKGLGNWETPKYRYHSKSGKCVATEALNSFQVMGEHIVHFSPHSHIDHRSPNSRIDHHSPHSHTEHHPPYSHTDHHSPRSPIYHHSHPNTHSAHSHTDQNTPFPHTNYRSPHSKQPLRNSFTAHLTHTLQATPLTHAIRIKPHILTQLKHLTQYTSLNCHSPRLASTKTHTTCSTHRIPLTLHSHPHPSIMFPPRKAKCPPRIPACELLQASLFSSCVCTGSPRL
eukprot:GHVN01041465.1.p1 GENE.GHVN01041465.1~~GHVN01041465.1.p1  ORF type:complete len:788 (+),score=206.73 GHVN01041465.1:2334-4697(+)